MTTLSFGGKRVLAALATIVIFALASLAPAAAESQPAVLQSALFPKALQAARHGRLDQFPESLEFFKGYPLRPYLSVARLRHELDVTPSQALDDRIRLFVHHHPDLPPARRLRRAWLSSLVDRKRWTLLLSEVGQSSKTSRRCGVVHARIATGDNPRNAALALWRAGHSQPHTCDPVFAWLKHQGLLTSRVIADRGLAAVKSGHTGLARYLARKLAANDPRRARLERSIDAAEHPASLATATRLNGPIAVDVFQNWALSDPVAAGQALPGIVHRLGLSKAQRYQMRRYIALLYAEEHRPGALDWYRRIDAARMADDEHALGWYIRAALYRHHWTLALKRIRALPPQFAEHDQWRYWRARALAELGHHKAADQIFSALATTRSYYGFMAADRIDAPYHFHAKPLADDAGQRRALAAKPGLVRAHLLFNVGMRHAAVREWRLALDGASQASLAQAAAMAHHWGWYSRAIITLARAGVWSDLVIRYPLPDRRIVEHAADVNDLKPALVYAIMRTESLFRPAVRSHAGAIGIMQLTPATARYVGRRLAPGQPSTPLTDPTVNITLGTRLLRHLDDRWQGNATLAIASYNAGKGKVAQWLPERPQPADIWIANISYTETRRYVERVFKHMTVFEHRLDEPVTRLDSRLSPVEPIYTTPESSS